MSSQKSILVAADDVPLLQVLAVRLRSEGYHVILAQDSHQAEQRATDNTPDLLLLDTNLPSNDGVRIQDRVKRKGGLTGTPVVYLTGATGDQLDPRTLGSMAVAVLHKPFDAHTLLATVRDALGTAAA